jgi:hypothetical protein
MVQNVMLRGPEKVVVPSGSEARRGGGIFHVEFGGGKT